MASRLPAMLAPELFSTRQLDRTMYDDYNNQARKPVCRFDDDSFRPDDRKGQERIRMDGYMVMVQGQQRIPVSTQHSNRVPMRTEGFPAQYPSAVPVRTQGTPTQYPSAVPVRTQGTPTQYPSAVPVRTQGTPTQYPGKVPMHIEGTPTQYPGKVPMHIEGTPTQYPGNVPMCTAYVSQSLSVSGGKRKHADDSIRKPRIDKKMVKTKYDLELFLQTDGGKKWKRHGPIKFEFGYRHNDAIFYSSSTDEGMVLTEEVVMKDYTFKLFQWVLDFDGEWDLIPLMGPRKKIKKAPTKAEDAFVDSLLK